MSRWWSRASASRRARDVAVAVALGCLDLVLFSTLLGDARIGDELGVHLPEGLVVLYALPGYAALVVRRRAPRTVLAFLLLHAILAPLILPYRPSLAVMVAIYTVAATGGWIQAGSAVAGALLVGLVHGHDEASWGPPARQADTVAAVVMLWAFFAAVGVVAGRATHTSRRQLRELELQREAATREAVEAERGRIAAEMHDIVSHTVTVMLLQASAAARWLDSDRDRARVALATIEELGGQATSELRRMLGVLRPVRSPPGGPERDAHGGYRPGSRRPGGNSRPGGSDLRTELEVAGPEVAGLEVAGPEVAGLEVAGLEVAGLEVAGLEVAGLGRVPALARSLASSGISVQVITDGPLLTLARSVDLAAFRVVQEALTNVARHAGPGSSAVVSVHGSERGVDVRVENTPGKRRDGSVGAAGRHSVGVGLIGLRERAEVLGGRLEVGPTPDGGYRLTAWLPTGVRT